MDFVVPIAVEFVAFDDAFRQLAVGNLDAFRIRFFIKPCVDFQPGCRACVADAGDHNLACFKRNALPVPGNVAEQTVLDLVPFACPRRVVANFDDEACLIGQPLKLQFPKPTAGTVASAAVGGDQQSLAGTILLPS